MEKFVDVSWPAEYNELKRIDELLHCRICYEYIKTSVVTPCSHNYCSICIRKFLHYKTQCPICFQNLYEKDLHANRVLDEFMECYLSLTMKLIACISGVKVEKNENLINDFSESIETSKKKLREEKVKQSPEKERDKNNIHLVKTPQKKCTTPSTSENKSTPKSNSLFELKSTEKIKSEIDMKRVPCPVCSIEISERNINKHLDDCLQRQKSMTSSKVTKNSLQPMPKYVTNLMKDSELRKLLKNYGLSTLGNRKVVEKRLQKFSVLYNAECDKLVPKSIDEIAKQCKEEEAIENNIVKLNSTDNGPNIDRKMDLNVIEEKKKQYLKKNKNDFEKLINTIRKRKKTGKNVAKSLFSSQIDEDCDVATTSSTSQTISQNIFTQSDTNDTNSSGMDFSQYLPQDSDSNAPYPLQHYSKDDPIRFLALGISTDSRESSIKLENCSPESKPQPSTDFHIKSEISQDLDKSVEETIPENPPPLNNFFSLSNANSITLKEFNETAESKSDIFDASTEDNWSDPANDLKFTSTRQRKFSRKLKKSKRTKMRLSNQSTDSETDIENSTTIVWQKNNENEKQEIEIKVELIEPNENGSSCLKLKEQELESTNCGDTKMNEGNSELSVPIDESTKEFYTRRSTRTRIQVSYETNSKALKAVEKTKNINKRVLDERATNVIDAAVLQELKYPLTDSVESENISDHQSINVPKRSLRKKRKTVKS